MELTKAINLWQELDPENKQVLSRKDFISSWKRFKKTPMFKSLSPSRPSLPKSVAHVSIFSFTSGQYFEAFHVCWEHRFGKSTPFPQKPLAMTAFFVLLSEISYPHNPRIFARLLIPKLNTVSLAPYQKLQIDHLAKQDISDSNISRLELLGRYPSEAIAAWRSMKRATRRQKAQQVFGLSKAKLPRNPRLVDLWEPLREALLTLAHNVLPKHENATLSQAEFDRVCGLEVDSYSYRIVVAYLVTKEHTINLKRLPRLKKTT